MSEMLLLGAGASVDAGVPGAYDMTARILENLRKYPRFRKYAHALCYVIGGLLFEKSKENINPLAPAINVEDLFNAVQLLAERNTLEAAPFINSWHPFLEEIEDQYASAPRPRALDKREIDEELSSFVRDAIPSSNGGRPFRLGGNSHVGDAIEKFVTGFFENDKERGPKQEQTFHRTNDAMIAALKDLVWIENANNVVHLAPLVNALDKQNRLVVATLNYDNGVELLASSQGVTCQTGLTEWSTTGRFETASAGLHLLKLHGSIDWVRYNNGQQGAVMPTMMARQATRGEIKQEFHQPALLFGNRNKLTPEGPFLALLRAFERELEQCETLTVVGYSFHDPHINVYISRWLNSNNNHILRIVNGPDFLSNAYYSIEIYINQLFQFSNNHPGQIKDTGKYAREGLIELYGEREFVVPQATITPTLSALEQAAKENEQKEVV